MSGWFTSLDGMLARVWQELDRGARDEGAAARRPVLATIGLNGGPEARTVVLREARQADATLAIHTDNLSEKVREIDRISRASLHVWDQRLKLQTRLRGRVGVETGAAVAWLWDLVPDGSRSSYGVTPAPGTRIDRSDAYTRDSDPSRFAVLVFRVEEIDVVHLSGDYHRRALFRGSDGWQGAWLAP